MVYFDINMFSLTIQEKTFTENYAATIGVDFVSMKSKTQSYYENITRDMQRCTAGQ